VRQGFYAQVIDGALRRAADAVGSELFTIVHKLEKTTLGHPPKAAARAERGQEKQETKPEGNGTSPEWFWLLGLDLHFRARGGAKRTNDLRNRPGRQDRAEARNWLAALDDFRNWFQLGLEARERT
jgi:hypothetical protein